MSGYLYGLAVLSVVIALVCVLAPASATQHIKLLCSLCVVILTFVPVLSLIRSVAQGSWEIPEAWMEQEGEEQDEDREQLAQDLLAGQLQVLLERDMALPPEQCRIYTEWEQQGGVRAVTLVLSGKAIWRDPDPIKAYVEQLLDCQCKVVLD